MGHRDEARKSRSSWKTFLQPDTGAPESSLQPQEGTHNDMKADAGDVASDTANCVSLEMVLTEFSTVLPRPTIRASNAFNASLQPHYSALHHRSTVVVRSHSTSIHRPCDSATADRHSTGVEQDPSGYKVSRLLTFRALIKSSSSCL